MVSFREKLAAKEPSPRNSPDGFHSSADDSIQNSTLLHVYRNGVFQSFLLWWKPCTQVLYMAILSHRESATTDELTQWVGCCEEQTIESLQEMLDAGCIAVTDGRIWKIKRMW